MNNKAALDKIISDSVDGFFFKEETLQRSPLYGILEKYGYATISDKLLVINEEQAKAAGVLDNKGDAIGDGIETIGVKEHLEASLRPFTNHVDGWQASPIYVASEDGKSIVNVNEVRQEAALKQRETFRPRTTSREEVAIELLEAAAVMASSINGTDLNQYDLADAKKSPAFKALVEHGGFKDTSGKTYSMGSEAGQQALVAHMAQSLGAFGHENGFSGDPEDVVNIQPVTVNTVFDPVVHVQQPMDQLRDVNDAKRASSDMSHEQRTKIQAIIDATIDPESFRGVTSPDIVSGAEKEEIVAPATYALAAMDDPSHGR